MNRATRTRAAPSTTRATRASPSLWRSHDTDRAVTHPSPTWTRTDPNQRCLACSVIEADVEMRTNSNNKLKLRRVIFLKGKPKWQGFIMYGGQVYYFSTTCPTPGERTVTAIPLWPNDRIGHVKTQSILIEIKVLGMPSPELSRILHSQIQGSTSTLGIHGAISEYILFMGTFDSNMNTDHEDKRLASFRKYLGASYASGARPSGVWCSRNTTVDNRIRAATDDTLTLTNKYTHDRRGNGTPSRMMAEQTLASRRAAVSRWGPSPAARRRA